MEKDIVVLGNGQIWDIEGIDPLRPHKIFEDLFSGRALEEMAQRYPIFQHYKEKDKITAISVTNALLSRDKKAKDIATALLKKIGYNAARGIELLTTSKARKKTWTEKERDYWKGLDGVIIGGGVSKGRTGRIIVKYIKEYLKEARLGHIRIFQAEFPGKESGFLGSIAYIFELICKEGFKRKINKIVGLGIDVGRSKIGIGALAISPKTKKVISLKQNKNIWFFQRSIKFPERDKLNIFQDSDRKYSLGEKNLGTQLREKILEEMASLCCWAIEKVKSLKMIPSYYIGIGLPGETTKDGHLIDSTHYLPFFRKQDSFHFSKELEEKLEKRGHPNYSVRIVNDGIAAGLANLRFGIGLSNLRDRKYAFLGPGSGLGGFVGIVKSSQTKGIR